jgi:hypothetical protein
LVREFNEKGTELLLALDLPRASYFLGKLIGYAGVALALACASTLALAWLAPGFGLVGWGISLASELILVTALTMFCVVTFAQIMPAVSIVLAFYLLARTISAIRLIAGAQLLDSGHWSRRVSGWTVDGLALVLPDLSRFTQTAWLVNADAPPALGYILAQTTLYTLLLSCAGLFDLYRKNL